MDWLTISSLLAIVAAVYLLVGDSSLVGKEKMSRYLAAFAELLKKHDGVFVKKRTAGARCYLDLDLAVGDNRARVSTEALQDDDGKVTGAWLQARCYLADTNEEDLRFHISRTGLLSELSELVGFEMVRTGFEDFDEAYAVRANESTKTQKLLNLTLQKDIRQLFQQTEEEVIIEVHKYSLLVYTKAHLGAKGVHKWFELVATLFADLLHYLQEKKRKSSNITGSEGPDEIKPMRKPWLPQGHICSFCGEPVVVDTALCRRCATSYHKKCWEYHGACQAYDCHCDELR